MRFDHVVIPMYRERMPALVAQHAGHDADVIVLYQEDGDPSGLLQAAVSAAGGVVVECEAEMPNVIDRLASLCRDGPIDGRVLYMEDDVVIPPPLWGWLGEDRNSAPTLLPRVTYNASGDAGEPHRYMHLSGLLCDADRLALLHGRMPRGHTPAVDMQLLALLDSMGERVRRAPTPAPLVHLTTEATGSAFRDVYEAWGGNMLWSDTPQRPC